MTCVHGQRGGVCDGLMVTTSAPTVNVKKCGCCGNLFGTRTPATICPPCR